jgi:hypothetical protein
MIRDVYNHAAYLEQRRGMMQEWADLVTTGAEESPPNTSNSGD